MHANLYADIHAYTKLCCAPLSQVFSQRTIANYFFARRQVLYLAMPNNYDGIRR